jgi:D-beta-D-heptose 7-phosphate kinase/D-beta-D-heptose 1-phosphate adenosyltransferase
MLLALSSVDYVCVFDEETPLELIKKVKPDFLVKGGDWTIDKIVGADFVQANGGEVQSLPFVDGQSTTGTIEQIIEAYKDE